MPYDNDGNFIELPPIVITDDMTNHLIGSHNFPKDRKVALVKAVRQWVRDPFGQRVTLIAAKKGVEWAYENMDKFFGEDDPGIEFGDLWTVTVAYNEDELERRRKESTQTLTSAIPAATVSIPEHMLKALEALIQGKAIDHEQAFTILADAARKGH